MMKNVKPMSKTKTKKEASAVDEFKANVKRWQDLSWKLREYGASDTEPDTVFQWCLRKASQGEDFKMPKTARDWQLFTGMKGVGLAATNLTKALQRCLDSLGRVTMAEQKELRQYLDGYLWRC